MQRQEGRNAERLAWVALLTVTLVRVWVAALTPLSPDEAYYWVWSHALAFGYPDHPPMVAMWIHWGTAIAGDTPLGVRMLAPFAGLLGTLALRQAGDDLLPGYDVGLAAAVLMNATLLFGIGSVTMTPDTPLLFFWTTAMWALGRVVVSGRPGWWLVAGLATGLAMDSKYTALLLVPAVFAWLLLAAWVRPWLLRAWPWLALIVALALFTPVVLWNAQHDWVSFIRQGGRAADWRPARALQFIGELLGGQVGLATPLIAILMVAGIGLVLRRSIGRAPGWTLLACLTVIPLLVFIQHAVGDRVQANWPSVIYPAACIAAAGLGRRWEKLWRPAVALGIVVTLAVWAQGAFGVLALSPRLDPTLMRLGGWEPMAREVMEEAIRQDATYVVSDNYGHAALLARLIPDKLPVLALDPRWAMFDLPSGGPLIDGRTGLLVHSERRADAPVATDWASMTPVGEVVRGRDGVTAERFRLYRVVGRAAGEAIAVLPRPGEAVVTR